jgi:hypothetical protein
MKLYIAVVNPAIERGGFSRDIKLSDIVQVPAQNRRPVFSVLDMLADDSVRNLITVYNELNGNVKKKKARIKAPHKA